MAVLGATCVACTLTALAQAPEANTAASLRDRYASLSEQLEHSPLQRGLYLESSEGSGAAQGDLYAVVSYPFATISDSLSRPESWCEALILHLNIKYCRSSIRGADTVLSVAIGRKTEQPLSDAYRVEFAYKVAASGTDYMQIDLDASKGPLGTRNSHIALELIALEGERSFLHVQYSYTYGLMARLAMAIYLATSGHGRVGFTMVSNGKASPHLVAGVRGSLERNTMRYYLALDAYLGTLATPEPQRFEESLERWFADTERYAVQLHEVDHDAYLKMKRNEYLRQHTAPWAGPADQ
jgi:hypothetical protein